jgi:endonuclease III
MKTELDRHIHDLVSLLRTAVRDFPEPIVTEVSRTTDHPFLVLASTILSLRTKDDVTREASKRLFQEAKTPQELLDIPEDTLAQLIYPVGFYRTKARTLKTICADLIEKYQGKVPDELDELLKLKGVGRKTANLVITLGFGKPGVCVDTHVHRISNRLGYVSTKTPEQTEMALRAKLPRKYWVEFNDLLVTYGQNVCKPVSPFCSKCSLSRYCKRVGVVKSR